MGTEGIAMSQQNDNDILSPNNSPTELGKRSGVRRVNNVPLYLIGGAFGLFLLIMMLVMHDRSNPTSNGAQEVKDKKDTSRLAESIAGTQTDGFIPAAKNNATFDLANRPSLTVPIAIPDDMDHPPLPERLKNNKASDPDRERIAQEKMQLFESAVKSKTSIPVGDMKSHPDISVSDQKADTLQRIEGAKERIAAVQNDPNTTFKARLAQLQSGNGTDNAPARLVEPPNSQRNGLKQFDSKDKTDRWKLDSKVEAPATPYTLRAGFVIPATLISGINSDLPGQIIGQISQNVYDTATGKYLLLPQGSRLVGSYTSDVAYGQSRVMVAWQRIVFPDGKTIDIGAMPGSDEAGYAGYNDQVNNHYLRLFGEAILMSGITAGVALSQNNNTNVNAQPTANSALSEALGQQLGTATAQMISKNLNISPTLEIRPGFRFNVMCIKDLALTKPYTSFDY
jgi:type IV secretory pathway VirB10-like protein